MGFGRDLGAAVTFGLAATTKHKEAEGKDETRRKQHQRCLNSYNEIQAQVQSGVEAMDAHFTAAQEVLLSTGADIRRQQQRDLRMVQASGRS
jgi:hypothetical protein